MIPYISDILYSSADTLLGMLIGCLILIFSQVVLYRFIEKGKLKTEREFSFQKEYYFNMEKKIINVLDTIYTIDTWLIEKDILLHGGTRYSLNLNLLGEKLSDKIPLFLENIHSITSIYLGSEDSFFEYHGSVDALYNLYSDSQNNGLAQGEGKEEFHKYNEAKDKFITELKSLLANKPN